MIKKIIIVLFMGAVLSHNCLSQLRPDTIVPIQDVAVFADRIYAKEKAGMKETVPDSIVLAKKIQLSLSELLSENTPIFVKSHGRGALATASFRGTAASHTQVSWNGININNPMSGMVDFSLIPVYIIDAMRLKHGAASIADKTGGLGGSINIQNTVDWNRTFSLKYMQGIGSYKTFDEFLNIGGGMHKKWQINTRLYHNYSKNDYTFINRGIGIINKETGEVSNPTDTNDHADFRKYGLLQEIYYRPNRAHVLSLKYWGQWAKRTIPRVTSYEGPDNSNLNKQSDKDHKVVLNWKHYRNKNTWEVFSGYAEKRLKYTLKNHVPGFGLIPAIYSRSLQRSSLNKAKYTHDFNHKFSLESGIDFNYHDVVSRDSVKKTGYEKYRQELSGFLALRKDFADRLNLNLMLRQDWTSGQFSPFVPFLGFDFRLLKEQEWLLKGNMARNYHRPSLNDLFWQPGGNPLLLPEDGFSFELGMEYRKAFHRQKLQMELTAYRSDIQNWIVWIPGFKGYWEPHNIKRVLSKGVEYNLSFGGAIGKFSYRLSGSYAYTSSINYGDPLVWGDESYGKQLVYVPLHSGNVLVHLDFHGFYAGWQHNSYSERFTTSGNDLTRRDWLYPYFMNDLSVGKEFKWKKIALSAELKIYNLFNETYHSILYRPMPKRNYMLILLFKWTYNETK